MTTQLASISKKMIWAGRIMSALPVLLFVFSAVMKLLKPAPLLEGFAHFGIPERLAVPLGILELMCTIIYLLPRTAVLGAILLTGYLGGAILTNLLDRGRGIAGYTDAELRTRARAYWLFGHWLADEARRRGLPVREPRPWPTLADRIVDAIGTMRRH